MKILQILTELEPAGAERVVLELIRGFTAEGHLCSLVVLKSPPLNKMLENEITGLGVTPVYLEMKSAADAVPAVGKLRRLIRNLKPDIVHSHLIHPNLISRFACAFLHIPLINTIHISERRSGREGYFLADGFSIGLCTACTAVSNASARFHEKASGLELGSIQTIRNGVDPVVPFSPEECTQLRIQWGVNICSRVLGCVGRLDYQKGFDRLIRAFPELSKRIPDGETWGIVLLGEGTERTSLEILAQKYAVPNILFRMPGFSAGAAREMSAFDSFLMPSRYEGYGLVLAEAMSLGLPCVVSPVDSLPELCVGYSGAFPADFSDPEAAADAVQKSLACVRPEPRILFTRAQMVHAYLDLYREKIKKSPGC